VRVEDEPMPVLWSVNHAARIVRVRLVEPLAFDDWFTTAERIAHDASIERQYRILVDRSGMRSLPDHFAEQMALYFVRRQSLFAERRIAILARPALVPSIAPVQAVLNGHVGAQSRVFTRIDDAHAWLVECDDKLAPIPW
jgi:hypothetical protein